MTPQERERFYDEQIAPALLKLGEQCNSNGLSFVAMVEWAPGDTGRTTQLVEPYGVGMLTTLYAARANGNVDALLMGIEAYAREHGHGSVYLMRLGIPTSVAGKAADTLEEQDGNQAT